ncbi:hypothetical protein L218DRAFT_920052 [Marasmius fiardii PR-910]|nr:hypothetical protein L218DRAFT_920052 [Marasmius fiardii PR-910]
MPLDGHSYLVSQGWSGKGTGLRQGAITRPIAITQKKSLAGVGKDRDEDFPFWDHLFSAASKSIQVKISNDDSEHTSDSDNDPTSAPTLKRTTTGILCNLRPNDSAVTSATASGTSTPKPIDSSNLKLSLIALAKREAAKRNLYSRFYRGPVLDPDPESSAPSTSTGQLSPLDNISETRNKDTDLGKDEKGKPSRKKRRKVEDSEENDESERRERKKRKKELKEMEKLEKKMKKSQTRKKETSSASEGTADRTDKVERRNRKEEKKKRKEEKLQPKTKSKPHGLVSSVRVSKSSEESLEPKPAVKSKTEKDADTILDSAQESTFPKVRKERRGGD